MKKLILLFILITFFCYSTYTQNNYYKSFNISGLSDVIKTYDNGFACLTNPGGILKLDSTTQLQFYKQLSCDFTLCFCKIIQTTDSGFIIETPYNPYDTSGIGCVVKFDKNGNYLWTKRYYHPTPSSNGISDIISSVNNEFYLLSEGCAGGTVLIECNETGDIIWQKTSNYNTAAMKIIRYSDNKFLIFGYKIDSSFVKIDIYMVDTSGNYLWLKEYDNNGTNGIRDIVKTNNNEYSILINIPDSSNSTKSEDATIHIDLTANILWANKTYPADTTYSNQMNSFIETNDKGYLYTGSLIFPKYVILYTKTDFVE